MDEKLLIFETKHWKVFLSKDQAYLGRCRVYPKINRESLSELTSEEGSEFFEVVKLVEKVFKENFGAAMFNWTCMMNNAYKNDEKPKVHWHVRPRYEKQVEFAGKIFIDSEFGYHYDRARRDFVSDEVLNKILNLLKKSS